MRRSVQFAQVRAGIVLAQDFVVALACGGHADGADLAHADAVAVAAARRRQRRDVAAGVAADLEHEHGALQVAERAADLELAAQLLGTAVSDEAQAAAAGSTITAAELKEMQDRGEQFLLVDVREPAEWEIVRIPGAVLIPKGDLPSKLAELPQDKPVVAYCKTGDITGENFLKQFVALHECRMVRATAQRLKANRAGSCKNIEDTGAFNLAPNAIEHCIADPLAHRVHAPPAWGVKYAAAKFSAD